MRPDRILLAELRAEEAFDYLRNVNSGHPGSITSVHATSAELAFEQLTLLVKQSAGGRGWRAATSRAAVSAGGRRHPVRCGRHQRVVSEIWFDPDAQARGRRCGPAARLPAGAVMHPRGAAARLARLLSAYGAVQAPMLAGMLRSARAGAALLVSPPGRAR